MGLFHIEGRFYQFMVQLKDIFILNVMWIIFSIPLITIGASTTAACSVGMKMYKNQEGYIARTFVREFKKNWKQGTLAWGIMLFLMYVIYLDQQILHSLKNPSIIFMIALIAAIALLVVSFMYTFPLLSRYENSVWQTIKNSYQITIRYIGRTLFMVAIVAAVYLILNWNMTMLYFMIVLGPGLLFYTYGSFCIQLFEKIEQENK